MSETSMDATAQLYAFYNSSCSWRLRIAMGFKKIQYDYNAVPLQMDDEARQTYMKINPMLQVPTLKIDGLTLCDSVAIMEYLEESRPENPLLPKDLAKRAKVREIVNIICSGIQPLQNTGVTRHVGIGSSLCWSQQWITRGFKALELVLTLSSGQYCVGDEITMADICLVPQVFNARKYKMTLEAFPTIVRINKNLEDLKEFSDAHPENMPDFPPEFKSK